MPTVQTGPRPAPGSIDAGALARDMAAAIKGEVRFDAGSRALYATDASNYRQTPIGVVVPQRVDDIVAAVAVARQYDAPVLARGGGTSLAGQCCNVAVVIDTSKYLNRVLHIDPQTRLARVQPGLVLDDLRDAAERHHLTFAPDPSTHNRCTLGGMIGNDSCGAHSVMAGKTVDNVESLDILTYDGLRMRVGKTSDAELEHVIREGGRRGEIYGALKTLRDRSADLVRQRFPKIPRRVSGYNLDQLLPENGFHVARALVGTEGTCVTVLEATVNLVHSPPVRSLLMLGYPDAPTGADDVLLILEHQPIALEGFDDHLTNSLQAKGMYRQDIAMLPKGGGWLLVEFGGETTEEAERKAHGLMDALRRTKRPPEMRLAATPQEAHNAWQVREAGLGGTAIIPGKGHFWPGWEDSAVPPERVGDYLRDLRRLMDAHHYGGAFYGHFGQGCIHTRIDFDLKSSAGIAEFRQFMEEAADLVLRYGGSLSGEHGDGQARAELLPKMYGPELVRAFAEFKAIWDPEGRMNPGKIVAPAKMDENLRLGRAYNPWLPKTHFQFPNDQGSFANAALRCVGVGKCRRHEAGTMCPSYMATREEQHSTRGRAHLLFEMLQGNPLQDGWRNETVHDALDLCLACKGCKAECPVNVDMATYKAEFLAHYYAGRRRPVVAYSMGLIYWWARLAAHMPALVNFTTHAPLLRAMAKRMAGISLKRQVPAFAPRTFKALMGEPLSLTLSPARGERTRLERRQPSSNDSLVRGEQDGLPSIQARSPSPRWGGGQGERFLQRPNADANRPPVILWADTFNNHFHPETALAAVEVLEAAGFQVIVPARSLCCGRPLYDFGMLDTAKGLLRRILKELQPEIRAGVPVVGLEPSCLSVFRDELCNLLPHDEDAQRLKNQTFMLAEFLEQRAPHFSYPKLSGKAVLHGHCHQKTVLHMASEEAVLRKLGVDYTMPDSGCCGMAGAFGFEQKKYDVSIACGERVLLPAVRQAAKETYILSNGFSCREQIAQTTDRRALHLAEVLQMALRGDTGATPYPERRTVDHTELAARQATRAAALIGAGVAVAATARVFQAVSGRKER
jgi:FAD/FMN-containing dehydrogenase/Fe-S oxidoreductase